MSILDSLTWYYGNLGLRGVLAVSAYRLFGRPKEITARAPGIPNAVHIRMRTTDVSVYGDVLSRGEYAFDLPFSPIAIIDAGANIGMASIYFAHKYPDARIIALEAEASNFAALIKNVQPYPSITPIHAALWNRDGEISVREADLDSGAIGHSAFVTREGRGAKVRAITMRSLMKEVKMNSVDILKVDIEGAEREVFESCDWMDDIRCLMIELHDRYRPGCSEAVDSVTKGFSKSLRRETTLYLRET